MIPARRSTSGGGEYDPQDHRRRGRVSAKVREEASDRRRGHVEPRPTDLGRRPPGLKCLPPSGIQVSLKVHGGCWLTRRRRLPSTVARPDPGGAGSGRLGMTGATRPSLRAGRRSRKRVLRGGVPRKPSSSRLGWHPGRTPVTGGPAARPGTDRPGLLAPDSGRAQGGPACGSLSRLSRQSPHCGSQRRGMRPRQPCRRSWRRGRP